MITESHASGRKLLLMGSSAFKANELPAPVKERIDEAIARNTTMIVSEAHGACRRDQDYLKSRGYTNVIVGHARSIRYNVGDWRTVQYGDDLKERERGMIEDCDSDNHMGGQQRRDSGEPRAAEEAGETDFRVRVLNKGRQGEVWGTRPHENL